MLQSSESNCGSLSRILSTLKTVVLLCSLAACFIGCSTHREKKLGPSDIHRITREFVAAANPAAPPGSEVRGELRAFEKIANSSDHVEIRVFATPEESRNSAFIEHLLQALGDVAVAHALHPDPQSSQPQPEPSEQQSPQQPGSAKPEPAGKVIHLTYRHAGVITHTIHIHIDAASSLARQANPPTGTSANESTRHAIIL